MPVDQLVYDQSVFAVVILGDVTPLILNPAIMPFNSYTDDNIFVQNLHKEFVGRLGSQDKGTFSMEFLATVGCCVAFRERSWNVVKKEIEAQAAAK